MHKRYLKNSKIHNEKSHNPVSTDSMKSLHSNTAPYKEGDIATQNNDATDSVKTNSVTAVLWGCPSHDQ